jgi:hypothetical protein
MDAKKLDTKMSNRNALFLRDACLKAPKRFSKLDQCAFTQWMQSAKAHAKMDQ